MTFSFRIFDIPVKLGPAIVVGLLFLGLLSRLSGAFLLSWIVLGIVAVLLHELGHALAFRRYGISSSISFFLLGGLTMADDAEAAGRLSDARSVVVYLAGPGVSLVVGAASLAVVLAGRQLGVQAGREILEPVSIWLFVNIGWGILNLAPISSLDGGQALRHLLGALAPGRVGVVLGVGANLLAAAAIAGLAFRFGQTYLAFIAILFGLASPALYSELLDAISPSRVERRDRAASAGAAPARATDPDEIRADPSADFGRDSYQPIYRGDPRFRP